ncbi:HNH endonuclease [Salisediminibacterium halotolerans]|uniref:HNH endonuclease n=1 Tax=Salisediminibacterium halotolerans TaxID=517425 RepID=UPI000EB0B5E0|nr:HNH endonuclease [Salisediminibacterium halotolerans]RLJ72284.1 HNH endonuclease [Actinophytocola xinjiangensis]RPE85498.1 HNH endonuclease [Salisediminibacterium halotolerans]TWG33453.1 HNH endonuclease [Salisediminibacterium halotolerans]GEL07064.1 hypothetical protein SHA02_04800 [Salisediminibacterium halotolerans]
MNENFLYNQIYEYAYPIHGTPPPKVFLGNSEDKQCIFCNRVTSEVTFRKIAHVVPAALGNRSLFNHNECDECNELIFSKYENDLVNYLQLERIFMRGRPRKGSPKYKPSGDESFIASNFGSNQVSIFLEEEEKIFELLDEDEQSKTYTLKCNNLPTYNPVGICKALVHMGFSVIEENMRNKFTYLYEWLKGNNSILPMYLDMVYIPGGGMAHVILEVWENKSSDALDFPLVIRFTYGHKLITLYVPANGEVETKPSHFNYIIHGPENITQIEGNRWTISSDKAIRPDDVTFNISYTHKE